MFSSTLLLTLLGVVSTLSLATPTKRTVSNGAVINKDFPDPGIMRNSDGTWYAYSTSSGSGLVPMSMSVDFVSWTSPRNVLSSVGPWADGCVISLRCTLCDALNASTSYCIRCFACLASMRILPPVVI